MVETMKLTDKETRLQAESASRGPVVVFNDDLKTARRLEKKGAGIVTSNPGKDYQGVRVSSDRPYGGYYVANGWEFNQETKSFTRIEE